MDPNRFDRWTRIVTTEGPSRRSVLRGALAALLAPFVGNETVAGKGGKKKKKPNCPQGTTACGDKCVDTATDRFNCGRCGNDCRETDECVFGSCFGCAAPLTRCGTQCVDITADATNCGSCGVVCPDGETCIASRCVCGGPHCPLPGGGTRCCLNPVGTCCANGKCCGQNEVCTPDDRCCPTGQHSCGNGNCCPDGTNCCPDGVTCCATACLNGGLCSRF